MYLAIDIGGTKTLVASLTNEGVISERIKFETPKDYKQFLTVLADNYNRLSTKEFIGCGLAVPGRIDRERGIAIAFGNLPWKNVPIRQDVAEIVACPVVIDNDANLAGLSEAMLLKDKYNHVLYVTISTGIGTGVIVNQRIEPALADSEGGHMLLEHNDKLMLWEDFASGRAIVERYGKKAQDIHDAATWQEIARNLAVGFIDLIAVLQPEIIVLGGGVGCHAERYKQYLVEELKRFETPMVRIPPIIKAQRPEDAVVYGCYDLAKSVYGKAG